MDTALIMQALAILLRLCDWLPCRAEDWLLDFLYPDDARITFHDVGRAQ